MNHNELNKFYTDYVKAIHDGTAAIFAGAGLSKSAGFVDWRNLMREIADDLKLNVDVESDLIAIAQFHQNKYRNRTNLNRLLIEEFTKDAELTENHKLIANLPIETIWTTNYDTLIEQAFKEAKKRVDTKITPENLSSHVPRRGATIYKMHGDISQPEKAVLTKEDYETYDLPNRRHLFSLKLQGDLVGKTFLFIGFSFTDPNLDYILSRIRSLLGENQGQHYCVMRWPQKPKNDDPAKLAEYEYERTKLTLRQSDLSRYGIHAILVDEYSDLTDVLREISRRSHLRDVYVSGAASSFEPFGQDRLEGLSRAIGRKMIESGYNLVSGVGLGIGSHVILGAIESLYATSIGDYGDRLLLRPFPRDAPANMDKEAFHTKYRTEMLAKAGSCVFIAGNKQDGSGGVRESNGVIEEFELAVKAGKYPIPIGATGHAARTLWERVNSDLKNYYPKHDVAEPFRTLGDESSTDEGILKAIVSILKTVQKG